MEKNEKTVLLIDDEDFYKEMIQDEIFKKTSLSSRSISTASSAMEAIKIIESGKKIDLIISDYSMPNGNGVDVVKFLNLTKNKTPIVIFTNSLDFEVPKENENFLGVINKFEVDSLMLIVKSFLKTG